MFWTNRLQDLKRFHAHSLRSETGPDSSLPYLTKDSSPYASKKYTMRGDVIRLAFGTVFFLLLCLIARLDYIYPVKSSKCTTNVMVGPWP